MKLLATPHVPHAWESIVLFEEVTKTLFCGDLFTHGGSGPAVTESDIVGPALAVMHGSSFRGDGAAALTALAAGYDRLFEAACRDAVKAAP